MRWVLVLVLWAFGFLNTSAGRVPHVHHFPAARRRLIHKVLGPGYITGAPPVEADDPLVIPTDFGADPTGTVDSSNAFDKVIEAVLAHGGNHSGKGVKDLGGVTVDLRGGVYSISRPVHFPGSIANFRIQRGTLKSWKTFTPSTGYLLQIGDQQLPSEDFDRDISVAEMTFDGGNVAGGCVQCVNTQYCNIGPAVLVIGFTRTGISLAGSGGGYIHQSWGGQYMPPGNHPVPNATVLDLSSSSESKGQHDGYVTDFIVFSAGIGLTTQNAANQLEGIHVWGCALKDGGSGIVIEKGAGRLVNSYMDFCPLVVVNPHSFVVTNTLFLAKAVVVLRATTPNTNVRDVLITNNWFNSENSHFGNTTVILDETQGKFIGVHDTTIAGNVADTGFTVKSTRAVRWCNLTTSGTCEMDFNDDLVFPTPIVNAVCTLLSPHGQAVGVAIKWHKIDVTLPTPPKEGDRVSCVVDQTHLSRAAL